MDLGLADRAAIITGSSRGIGRAIAAGLADEGCHVAICARGGEALRTAAGELRARGVKVVAETCDVSDPAALDAFLEAARAGLGRVDILVNNASGFGTSDDDHSWQVGFDVDVMASVRASRKVIPWLDEAGGGVILHISTTAALEAPGPVPYSALKAALISHSKNLAVALSARRIRVNVVAPGSIEFDGGVWDQVKRADRPRYDAMLATIPSGRMGTAEEVADAVVFLASHRASWITGVVLSVDGGQHKGNL